MRQKAVFLSFLLVASTSLFSQSRKDIVEDEQPALLQTGSRTGKLPLLSLG